MQPKASAKATTPADGAERKAALSHPSCNRSTIMPWRTPGRAPRRVPPSQQGHGERRPAERRPSSPCRLGSRAPTSTPTTRTRWHHLTCSPPTFCAHAGRRSASSLPPTKPAPAWTLCCGGVRVMLAQQRPSCCAQAAREKPDRLSCARAAVESRPRALLTTTPWGPYDDLPYVKTYETPNLDLQADSMHTAMKSSRRLLLHARARGRIIDRSPRGCARRGATAPRLSLGVEQEAGDEDDDDGEELEEAHANERVGEQVLLHRRVARLRRRQRRRPPDADSGVGDGTSCTRLSQELLRESKRR